MNKFFILALLFLSAGCSNIFAQTCITDSLISSSSSDAGVSQGVFMTSSKWLPGQKLRVKFLDGNENVIAKVKQYAEMWEKHANIDFVFVSAGEAEIRVSFKYRGSWSFVGKMSQMYSSNGSNAYRDATGASMNFGWFSEGTNETDFRRTTLHEFGHALGLLHEHKNSNRTFEWNIPVVLNDYMTKMGWSKEQVYEQVIERYGNNTEYSNKDYDKYSIMHYDIPSNHTKDGYAVGVNTSLSAGDQAIIKEMYPGDNSVKTAVLSFKNINIEHNVYQENLKGMRISVDLNSAEANKQKHRMSVYFYSADGKSLKDTNQKYRTTEGNVAVGEDFTLPSSRVTLFMPYSELHLDCGDYRLKFEVYVWKAGAKLAKSGSQYFSLGKCPTASKVQVDIKQNVVVDGKLGMKIYPMFAVKRAKKVSLRVSAFFYNQDGTTLKDSNNKYSTTAGNIAVWKDIEPCCDPTSYSLGDTYDFYLFIPYDELHLPDNAKHNLKFFVLIRQEDRKVGESDWKEFSTDNRKYDKIYVENACSQDIKLLVYFKNMDNVWEIKGWYALKPGKVSYIEDTRNRIFYYFAESADYVWKGDDVFTYESKKYGFRKFNSSDVWGIQKVKITCSGK